MTELPPLTDRLETFHRRVIPADHLYSYTIYVPSRGPNPAAEQQFRTD